MFDVRSVSPPRVCAAAREQGLSGGWPIDKSIRDPTTGRVFDLPNKSDQNDIHTLIHMDCP